MTTGESNPLAVLIGNNLDEVTFIMDYWQLVFFGMRLTVISDPQVAIDNVVYTVDTPGFRDALVGLISKKVTYASVVEGDEIKIEFENNGRISISLKDENYRTAEAASFVLSLGKGWWVW